MVAEHLWEQGHYGGRVEGVEIVGQTVLYDQEEGLFKMWYVPWAWEDRWAGLLAGPSQARISTRPFTFKGSKLLIDVDASIPQSISTGVINFDECEVRAALAD